MPSGRRPFGLGLNPRARGWQRTSRRALFTQWETLSTRPRHPVIGVISVLLHAAVLLLLLSPRVEQRDRPPSAEAGRRTVRMMYLLPKEVPDQPKPQPRVKPPRLHHPQPAPAFAQAVPERVPEFPSLLKNEVRVPDHDQPAATSPDPVQRPGGPERSPAAPDEEALVTEAHRLFGRASSPGATVAGPVRAGLPLQMMGGGPRCAWSGAEPQTSDAPTSGWIEGIVRTESSSQPVAGAFLQILGTGSATFADESGRYRLTFDPALVGACRSQLVRVTAPGFRARTMVLTYGRVSDNTIDLARSSGLADRMRFGGK